VPRKFVILDSAKEEYKEIKRYVQADFGASVWHSVNAKYKNAFKRIEKNPELGNPVDALKELGVANIKYVLLEQTRIVYEFDDELVLVHMLIHTKRDFRTHLLKRMLGT